ncbi:hypothetical protein QYE76_041530 [Lolium multiflorum]|uniref:Transposase (putative) gypsy type domain-containing protein n=1 Tax=Lolium multiflorum TaxID=4521 RepID=A0AAD8TF26_LOLMU|nr:hypothetical protein QYE76_041530 [Lolium multiflorum]
MPPRAKLTKHTAPNTDAAMEDVEISGWERSKLSNQDKKSLKKLGLMKKKDSLIFPGDESAPNPPIGYRLHQLTPNSILHISLFITLCECFLGTHPHWGMWKRIFYRRRNNSRIVVYNVGGACICVRPDVVYSDVKFPDSVQGWRKRWLYIKDETVGSQEYEVAPFNGAAEILRCRSWDAEASAEEKVATDALMKRIHQLQNTRGEELSGVQITAYFLRIRVQLLQARKKPLWMYAGEEDVDRLSEDLSTKDLEKLIRCLSSLSKKDEVPTSCRVEPYSGSHALPENHQILSSLPPFLKVERWMSESLLLTTRKNPLVPRAKSGTHKYAASSEKENESTPSESGRSISPPLVVSPRNKRKREEVEDSGSSKPPGSPAEETSPEEEGTFYPYDDAGSPLRDQFIRLGSQSIGFRNEADTLKVSLRQAEERAEALEAKLKLSKEAREKAEADVATVEDLRQRLANAENALSDKIAEQITREQGIIDWHECQNRRFLHKFFRRLEACLDLIVCVVIILCFVAAGRNDEGFKLLEAKDDRLLDALSICELQGDLARTNISNSRTAFTRLFPHFSPKQTQPEIFAELVKRFLPTEDLALAYRQENLKIGVEGTIALVANSGQEVDWAKAGNSGKMNKEKWKALVKDAKPHSKKILAFLSPKPAGSTSTAKTEVK